MKINKGMYSLKEAGVLVYSDLKQYLSKYGYHPTKYTLGLQKHYINKIIFTLVVDNFGMKYLTKEYALYLHLNPELL